jgi:hypothetical protein
MNDRDYAIVVGISKYGSIKPELEGPEKDAQTFYDWLLSPTGGWLPKGNIGLVLSSICEKDNSKLNGDVFRYEPTLTRVNAEFAKLMGLTAKNSQNAPRVGRRLYVYLSGHGITPRTDPNTSINLSGLLMANCVENAIYDYVSGQAYAEWFRLSHGFDEILVFMDFCRTDKPEVPPQTITTPIVEGGRVKDVQVFYAWATQWDALAWEQPLGAQGEKRGVFSYALMEALNSGPTDEQGQLTPKGIVGYLAIRILQLRKGDGSQRPQFYPPQPDGSIVIVPRLQPLTNTNMTFNFGQALWGQQVELQDGFFNPMGDHTADDKPWPLTLKPGSYVLRVAGIDRNYSVRPNETKTETVDA